jgi:hypothetical protein
MRIVTCKGYTIGIKFFGTEKIFYDGKEVSRKNSLFGATHIFRVNEDRKEVQYEVKIGLRFIW